MRVSKKAETEQNYWLSFGDVKEATLEQRLEFFHYDSHGGTPPVANPILLGKIRHGQYGGVLRDSYFAQDGSWVGGLELVRDYLERPFGIRPLREWFGDEAVTRWIKALGA